MTPKTRMITALTGGIPDMVPTFELEFQLEEEMFGRKFITEDIKEKNIHKLSQIDLERAMHSLAEYMVKVYTTLEYSVIPIHWISDKQAKTLLVKYIREIVGDTMMITHHGDGTFAIPDGNDMYAFAYAIADDPDGVKKQAEDMANTAIENNKWLQDIGMDCLILCSDYCYNSGPFVSPEMFGEYIQPYLYKIIDAARKDGMFTIKHTDGDIMPILDQLVECKPHAIHSIDPMAGVDIKKVKEFVGTKVALCGNVHCAALQTGTEQEIIESAEYCLTHAKPGGGYVFCTSNIPFKGMDPKRYQLVLDVWKRMRDY